MQGRQWLALAGAALFSGISGGAQAPQTPPSVTFQVDVDYVDVDAVVTDESGRFVPGLTRDDFEVFEDAAPQKIQMFSYVELPVEPAARFAVRGRTVSSDVRSNRRPFDGRVYVLVMDDLDISPLRGSVVKRAAREFVERHFVGNDIAAVVYTSGRTDATQDFTSDRALLTAAIDKFVGRRFRAAAIEALERHYQRQLSKGLGDRDAELAPDPGAAIADASAPIDVRDTERDQRAHAVLDTLASLGTFMAGVRGRRKAIVLFSEGVEMPIRELYGVRTSTDVVGAIKDAITAAARSNVNFFAIDPRGLIGMTTEYIELAGSGAPDVATGAFGPLNAQQGLITDIRVSQDTLRTLAEETGGFAAVNTNDFSSAFRRIVDANSRYYVLGYYPPAQERDGRFHRIEVRVKRPGLRVTARRGYAAPHGRTAAERRRDEERQRARDARKDAVNNTTPELREALNAPLQQSGLAFSVHAAPFRTNGRDASIALAIEFDPGGLEFAADNDGLGANRLELSFFAIDQNGRARRSTRTELNLTLRPESVKRVSAAGLRVNPRLVLAPGRYQIRVGARESLKGRLGTVFCDLEVPDFRKDPLMLSGLLVTAGSSQAVFTAQPDPSPPKLLPGAATSRRTFSQNDKVTVFAEIYDNSSRRQPRQVDAGITLISESGQTVFSATDSISKPGASLGAADAAYWSAYGLTRDIPLTGVAAGRYLLRVEARVRGDDGTAVQETLITVQP